MEYKVINHVVAKKDSQALVTGQPVYTDDLRPKDCLIVKALRSPHARAIVKKVNKSAAEKVPGIVCIVTAEDVPQSRFTIAGQTYPELSPYDRLILDKQIRFVGDPVALVAGTSEDAVDKALRVLRVEYEVQEPLLDFTKALDNDIVVHPEDNWKPLVDVGGDNKRNLVAQACDEHGDVDAVLASSDVVIDRTYHTRQNQQGAMETFRAYAYKDAFGRLTIVSSTQVPFHVRRVVANALEIPKSKIRVIKPRIGGGFGSKQTVVMEVYPAYIAWLTGKPAYMVYSREESMTVSTPRHESQIRVVLGASKDGHIRGIFLDSLWNAGAYGEHTPTTVTLSGHKSIPLYNAAEAFRFSYTCVYTNTIAAGAYRGYGATQGLFALETAVNELAAALHMSPVALRLKNMVRQGQVLPAYFNETALSCTLDKCLERVVQMSGWKDAMRREIRPPETHCQGAAPRALGISQCCRHLHCRGSHCPGQCMALQAHGSDADGRTETHLHPCGMGTLRRIPHLCQTGRTIRLENCGGNHQGDFPAHSFPAVFLKQHKKKHKNPLPLQSLPRGQGVDFLSEQVDFYQ